MFSKFNIALIIYCCLVFKSVVVGSQPNITQLQCDCGRANERGPKIVGGAEVHPYKYPWMVAVYLGYFFHCGGSLITRQYVLTSASCLKMNGSISVGIAVHNWAWPHQRIAASEVKIHPNYKRKESSYDVGLIKLSKAVTISERVRPLCLPQNVEYERPGRHAIAAGWGETKSAQTDGSQGSLVNQYLKEIESRIVNTNDSIITAVGVNGRGVCYGDSGSPLFTRYADGKFHVIGVISRGPSNCSGPFLSPRISPINQWIRRNVMDSEPCEKAIYQIKPNDTSYM